MPRLYGACPRVGGHSSRLRQGFRQFDGGDAGWVGESGHGDVEIGQRVHRPIVVDHDESIETFEEGPVVADSDDGSLEAVERLSEGYGRFDIEVVCGLIEEELVVAFEFEAENLETGFLAAG